MTPKLMSFNLHAPHVVYRNAAGTILPGVTTVLGMLDKPALLHWAWKLGRDGVRLDAARNQATNVGSIAHALCEAHLQGMKLDTSGLVPTLLDRAETSFLKFLAFWEHEALTVVQTEWPMVSEAMQAGGTLDILARRANGRLVVIDLKTSNAIYDEMLIQAATYAAMYEEVAGCVVDDVLIVRIGKGDDDDLEIRTVGNRPKRVAAFVALAKARRALQEAGLTI